MKILAFSDIHGKISYLKEVYKKCQEHNPDVIIGAGDLLNFWRFSNEIKNLLEKFDKLILLIHGNHESPELIDRLCSKNVINVHKNIFRYKNFSFLGYGGGGFEQKSKELENYFGKIELNLKNWVFITHAPPFNTKLDVVSRNHVGSISIRKVIEDFQPNLNVCGHLHENFNLKDKIKKTRIINPGPLGELIII